MVGYSSARLLPLAWESPERCNLFGLLGNFQRYGVLRLGKFPNKLWYFPCKYLYGVSGIRLASVVYLYTLWCVLNGGCPFLDNRLCPLFVLVFKCCHCSHCIDQRDAPPYDWEEGGKWFRADRNINLLPAKTKGACFKQLKLLRQGTGVRKTELRRESIRSERAMQHSHPTLKPSSPYACFANWNNCISSAMGNYPHIFSRRTDDG